MIAAPSVNPMTPDRARDAREEDRPSDGTGVAAGAFEALLAAVQNPVAPAAVRQSAPPASEVFDAPPAGPRQVRLDTMRKEARRQDLIGDAPPAPSEDNSDVEGDRAPAAGDAAAIQEANTSPSASIAAKPSASEGTSSPPLPPHEAQDDVDHGPSAAAKADAPPIAAKSIEMRNDMNANVRSAPELTPTPPIAESAITPPSAQPPLAELIGRSLASGGDDSSSLRADRATMTSDRGSASTNKGDATQAKIAAKSDASDPTDETDDAPETDFDRIVRSIRMHQGSHRSRASFELDPPELGKVRVEAQLNGERLDLQIQTETPEARQALGERIVELRHALEQQGLTWGDVSWQDGVEQDSQRSASGGASQEDGRWFGRSAVDDLVSTPLATTKPEYALPVETEASVAAPVLSRTMPVPNALDVRA